MFRALAFFNRPSKMLSDVPVNDVAGTNFVLRCRSLPLDRAAFLNQLHDPFGVIVNKLLHGNTMFPDRSGAFAIIDLSKNSSRISQR